MEINEFVSQLKKQYGYSDEMEQFLQKALPAMITYYGEDKKNIIFAALSECEIHIQEENENTEQFLNQYFGTNQKWDIPLTAGAFQHTHISVDNDQVISKRIIYLKTVYQNKYKLFDFNDEGKLSGIIHEICHDIKGYGKMKVENGRVITSTGLIKDYYDYDRNNNSFTNTKSDNTGLEEALNSYDEASIMTIMTGKFHEFGAYKGMTQVARELMKHDELAQIIKTSQFGGGTEWVDFLGKDASEFLSKNFEDWVSCFYVSPSQMLKDKAGIMEKKRTAINNLIEFVKNYTTQKEIEMFIESRKIADQKIMEVVNEIIYYNSQTNSFNSVETDLKNYKLLFLLLPQVAVVLM